MWGPGGYPFKTSFSEYWQVPDWACRDACIGIFQYFSEGLRMCKDARKLSFSYLLVCLCGCIFLLLPTAILSQQTLGGITGTVTDASGASIADTQVTLVADATKLTRL